VLRIPEGESTFDDGFVLDPLDGDRVSNMWFIDDTHFLTLRIEGEPPPADDLWSYYDLPVTPFVVDVETGAAEAYPHVPAVAPMNTRKLWLDGVAHYQINSFTADGLIDATEVVALGLDGVTPAFTLQGGDVLTLQRIR